MEAFNADSKLDISELPLVRVLKSDETITGNEYVIKPRNRIKHLVVNAAPIKNTKNQTVAAAAIFSDITDAKEMEQRKDDFVNMASHELKTPITSIKLFLSSLENRISTQKDQKTIRILHGLSQQTDRLQKLVSDLLDVSRLQTGKLTMNQESFILEELIQETIKGIDGGESESMRIQYQPASQTLVVADKFRISQVVTNLVTNALKYSDNEIKLEVKPSQDKTIVVSVTDFGIGIPKEKQHRIFERLYQVSEEKENTFPGFGMGLYISKELVSQHRGKIWVESQKGKGSTFSFSLPIKAAQKQKQR